MKNLQLTSTNLNKKLPDFYLSEDALIFPDCKSFNSKILVSSYLNDSIEIEKFNHRVNEIYNLILPVISNYLNHIHKENYSNLYWERIIGFWLQTSITNYIDKFSRLNLAFKKESNIITNSISFSSFQLPLSTREFLYAARENDFFHLQQYSLILNEFFQGHVKYITHSFSFINDVKINDKTNLFIYIRNKIRKMLLSILDKGYTSKIAFYVSLFSNKELFTFFWKSRFRYAPILNDATVQIKREIDINMRSQITNFSTNNELANSILYSSVKYFLPIEILEGYEQISNEASNNIKTNIPKSIFTGIGFYWSSQFSVWAAKCAELGTKIYGMQHGGTYGEVQVLNFESMERKISDKYITWGWSDDDKTIPMPASRLISRKKKFVSKRNQILWVTTADSRFNYFVGQIVFGNRFLQYFDHQINLYKLLPNGIKNKIKVRLYKYDFRWKLRERFLDAYPNINFANNSENFIVQASNSKLVIIDHFGGTTFLELLSLNIPVIIVDSSNLFIHRSEASSLYKSLKDVGVVFTSNEEAAIQIPLIVNDIENWMLDKERKKAIDSFKNNFALTNKNAMKIWLNFIKKY